MEVEFDNLTAIRRRKGDLIVATRAANLDGSELLRPVAMNGAAVALAAKLFGSPEQVAPEAPARRTAVVDVEAHLRAEERWFGSWFEFDHDSLTPVMEWEWRYFSGNETAAHGGAAAHRKRAAMPPKMRPRNRRKEMGQRCWKRHRKTKYK